MRIVEKRAFLSYLRDITDFFGAALLMLVPRGFHEWRLTRLLLKHYPQQFAKVVHYKSGRAALTALFEKLAVKGKQAIVLLPDYICNVVYMSASKGGVRFKVYRTDELFRPDLSEIKTLLETERVCAVFFASIFGTQNNTSEILSSVRAIAPDVVVIFDECQNLIIDSQLVMDSKTVCVLSFNAKTVPGLMGGALCLSSSAALDIERPTRTMAAGFLHELRIWGVLFKRLFRRLPEIVAVLRRGHSHYEHPALEFSSGEREYYDFVPHPAARLSLIYAFKWLRRLPELERLRRHNYAFFQELAASKGFGAFLTTERAEVAPYIPFRLTDQGVFGGLPIKGPYAMMADSSKTLRTNIYSVKNNGDTSFMFSKLHGTKGNYSIRVANNDDCGKVRVCHLTTAHKALDTRIFSRQAVSLQKAGYAVTIIGQHPSDEIVDKIKIISLKSSARWSARLCAALRIPLIALKEDAAVYHFHDPELVPVGCLLKLLGREVIYDVHEDYEQVIISRGGNPLFRKLMAWFFRRIESLCSRAFDFIVVVDSNIRAKFMKDNVEMITNFPPIHFAKAAKRERQDDRFRLIFLGTLLRDRGIPEILSAIEQMRYRDQVELHLIGSVRESGLFAMWRSNPRVIHHGRVALEQVSELLSAADVGLFPYQPTPARLHLTGEGITKLFEYMGSGLPVVYSDFPKLRRLLDPIGCGVAVDPTDSGKIARALDGLYEDPLLRSAMGERGREAVEEKFNWGTQERKLVALYRKVLDLQKTSRNAQNRNTMRCFRNSLKLLLQVFRKLTGKSWKEV